MTQPSDSPTFYLQSVGIVATAQLRGGRFVVLAGSQARAEVTGSYEQHAPPGYRKKRAELIAAGKLQPTEAGILRLTEDTDMGGTTPAAVVLLGRNADGTMSWTMKKADGTRQTYAAWEAAQAGGIPAGSDPGAEVERIEPDWPPFVHELATRLLDYETRQPELAQLLRDLGISVNADDGEPLAVIDPFTFIASIKKHSDFAKLTRFLTGVQEFFQIPLVVPTSFTGLEGTHLTNAWFFAPKPSRQDSDIPLLWELARQAVAGKVRDETFQQVLNNESNGLGTAKLTLGLFLLNPTAFLPLNKAVTTYLETQGVSGAGKVKNVAELEEVLREARALAPDFVSLLHAAWLAKNASEETRMLEARGHREDILAEVVTAARVPLNQILYGPPGTGKTFQVVERALAVLDPAFLAEYLQNRAALKARYDEFVTAGAVSFVTFHQSFGYEDFIEGIKPVMQGGQLKYRIEDGIFLEAVRAAGGQLAPAEPDEERQSAVQAPQGQPAAAQVWRIYIDGSVPVSQLREQCLVRGEVRIGSWNKPPQDLTLISSEELNPSQVLFRDGMRAGDLILLATTSDQIGAVGIVNGEYRFDPGGDPIFALNYAHARSVNWLATGLKVGAQTITGRRFAPPTLQRVAGATAAEIIQRLGLSQPDPADKTEQDAGMRPHVLIIDEINRGNVAKIFGELITLLETEKRAGGPEALTVKLPLSRRALSVPDSLYVIGTMNTADRSLTQLDTALRRRFVFHPVWPEPSLLQVLQIDGQTLDLRKFLYAINDRIERLLSREQVIGHAYLLGLPATLAGVASALRERILPQLEEHFFDDWSKIREVLADAGKEKHLQFLQQEDEQDGVRYRVNESAFGQVEAFTLVYSRMNDSAFPFGL